MKIRSKGVLALWLASLSGVVHAQGSVTFYGVLDTGIDFASNVDGQRLVQMSAGVSCASLFGLRGVEALGDGLSAVFRLESGFSSTNGSLDGGLEYSRNAYAGLSSATAGTVTIGRQWDPVVDLIAPYSLNQAFGGWYFSHPNDMDDFDNGYSIPNAVKYTSPNLGGFTAEVLYSFGGHAGRFSNDSAYSGAVRYKNGPFSAGAGYLRINDPESAVVGYQDAPGYTNAVYGNYLANARSQGIFGAGVSYALGAVKLMGDFTDVDFQQGDDGQDVKFQNYEVALAYAATPVLNLAAGYTYTMGRDHATGEEPSYRQVNLIAEYELSKRTAVYAMASLQKAGGGAAAQVVGFDPSSGTTEEVTRIGMRHTF